jgi:hypothetical protein
MDIAEAELQPTETSVNALVCMHAFMSVPEHTLACMLQLCPYGQHDRQIVNSLAMLSRFLHRQITSCA